MASQISNPTIGTEPTHTPRLGPKSRANWEPPAEFDGYQLKACIGVGAMGRVYLAQDAVLDRPVAVKFIDVLQSDSHQRDRFLVEARAIARLQHPNVVAIYRIGQVGGYPYIASEFIRGDRLDEIPVPVPSERVIQIGLGLARGLAAAHRRGVVHRDIKPANVILSEGSEVKLLDFGLAKLVEASDPSLKQAGFPLIGRVLAPRPPPTPTAVLSALLDSKEIERTQELRFPVSDTQTAELTHFGAVVGTPGYIAPEVWEGEPATFRSDVYSLGAVLYRLCTGSPPYQGRTLDDLREAALAQKIKLLSGFGNVDPRLATVIHRCLSRKPEARFASGAELRDALESLSPEHHLASLPEGNPYRGLQAFEAEHRALFFGRDVEIRAILDRLRNDSFVLVAGTSGVGKSSLCRAGILPRISESGLWDERRWTTVLMTPGKRPVSALATVIAPYLELEEDAVAASIRTEWREVYRELRKRQKDRGPLLIFIDQLEELVTLSESGDAAVMAEVLESFSTPAPGLRLLATVRGDFLVRVASLPGLSEEVTRAVYLLKPLTAEHVREAIIGPARAKGVEFESYELVEGLVKSTVGAEGALPLLQFALAELWEARDSVRNVISGSALEASGGVTGALARHADRVLASLQPEQRSAARRLLLLLITLEGTRARQTEKDLGAENLTDRRALAALVRGRLLTATDSPEGSAYEVAHEALINSWPTLRRWLEEDAERRILRDRLSSAISEWERLGRKREALWSARQLAEATLLEDSQLLPREKVFLEASHRAVRFKRRLSLAIASALVLALAVTYFGVQLKARRDLSAQVQALVSEGAATLARARAANERVEELRTQALSLFDNKQIEGGEEVWDRVRVLSAQTDALRAEAGRSLEAAVALGKEAPAARALLADVLYERALQADRDGRAAQRDELIARLPLYDDGTRKAKWTAPARLSLRSVPAGTQVTIQHYREREAQNPELENWGPTLKTPLEQLELPLGSYLLTLIAPGAASVRVPILLRRGEERKLSLEAPQTNIPAGFVYIPPGPFLFGSSTEGSLRKDYLHTVPLHEITTGPYLIAQHETTFAEWLKYLASLPVSERTKRAPSVGDTPVFGALSLKPVASDWQLTLRLGSQRYVMRTSEPLELQDRNERRRQNWLQLPIVGISPQDALSYLAWLNSSGTVAHARLCTEYEWEKAARGADGREYPHGDYLLPTDANFNETYEKKASAMGPDEVGSHSRSRSPFGIDDMSGNVWEMTRSSLADDQYIARGGAYFFSRNTARSSDREVAAPTYRDITFGLRVCADVR